LKVVYTALFGDYKLFEVEKVDPTWKYICFTDQDIKSSTWEIRKIRAKNKRKISREIKIKSHEFFDYDICLYIDAKFKIKIDIEKFSKNLKNGLCLMKHNKRSCLYDEGYFCIQKNKDTKDVILKQLDFYKTEGMPKNFGLYAPGIMLKRNTKDVNSFMNLWFEQVNKFSYRDIISFSYVLWKNPIVIDLLPFRETYSNFK